MTNSTSNLGANIAGAPGVAANITYLLQCTPALCDMKYATMRYVPNLVWNEVYLGIFAGILLIQLIMVIFWRTWSYTAMMFPGLLLECVGYFGRILMHKNIFDSNQFLINIIGLTIAPVFFTAAMYLTLARIIVHYGIHNSFLSPGWYTGIFLTADIISLIGQSVGGGIANMASNKKDADKGVHIMVAGLAFQIVSMTFFMVLVGSFFLQVRKDLARQRATNWAAGKVEPPTTHVKGYSTFVWMFTVAFFLILIRSCFRVAELAHGFDGKLANEEVPFMVLEGGMMIGALFLMTIFHPGRYCSAEWKKKKDVKEVDGRKFSIGSGSDTNGSGFYPTGRPTGAAFNPVTAQQQQWPMHDVRLQ